MAGCQAPEDTSLPPPMERPAQELLTDAYARYRGALLSDVGYDLQLAIHGSEEQFAGEVRVRFDLAAPRPLTLDFAGGSVESLTINGAEAAVDYNGAFIRLDAERLRRGDNEVQVSFRHPYSRDGSGLHRMRDRDDGNVYLYSHFEPYDANRLFPCFDQPDLRAVYTLSVSAPAEWEVVSATAAGAIDAEGERRRWRFGPTEPFSTYLFPLHAGPFHVWEDNAGDIPLRLLARRSLAGHVDAERWFDLTRRGFEFYQSYFDIPYPYGKYDQVIVPDLNIGAMENVAAVTFNESYVVRGEVTRRDRERLADTLLHEMAHMWFGNLVTPQWWDGLWLKEAFATFMAHVAMHDATEFDDAWHSFYAGAKQRGYRADERVTTHAIEVPVADTHTAFANFDSITYNKGASALAQLARFVGDEGFRDGVRAYLKQHAGASTTLEDFIGALEQAAGLELQSWVDLWLTTSGLDYIEAEYRCEDGAIAGFALAQRPPADADWIRPHRLQVSLHRRQNGQMLAEVTDVRVDGERTEVPELAGAACPDLVLVNHGDWTFARTPLDERTVANFRRDVGAIADPLVRSMLWQSLWDMVRDARYPLDDFLHAAIELLPAEDNERVVRQVLGDLSNSMTYLYRLATKDARPLGEFGPALEDLTWQGLQQATPGSDLQKLWFDGYLSVSYAAPALERIAAMLDGELVIAGLELDQDRRWQALLPINSFGHGDFLRLTEREAAADGSERGRKMKLANEVIRPDPDVKEKWLTIAADRPESVPLGDFRVAAGHLFPAHQYGFHRTNVDRILNALEEHGRLRENAFLRAYSQLITPFCDQSWEERLTLAIDRAGQRAEQGNPLHPILLRALLDTRQSEQRCQAILARLYEDNAP